MISALLDIVAPRAKARLETELNTDLENFLSNLKSEHHLIESNERRNKFRVNGDFFADLKATDIIVGENANSEHDGKIGFDLCIENGKNSNIILKAEERVIFGYLEIIGMSSALEKTLTGLVERYDREETD